MKKLSRREFISTVGAGLSVVGAGGFPLSGCRGSGPEPVAERPNILLFLTDQERFPWHLQSRDDESRLAFSTSGRDSLREVGAVEFARHYTTSPVCSPSRATLMTGLFPHQHGIMGNIGWKQPDMDPGVRTAGHMLREGGYRVAYRGKWHLSDLAAFSGPSSLKEYGFNDFQGGGILGDTHVGWQEDERNTESAVQWIRQQAGGSDPWFLVVSLVNPHDISWPMLYPRRDWVNRYRPAGPANMETFAHLLATKPFPQAKAIRSVDRMGLFFAPRRFSRYTLDDWRRYNSFYAYLIEQADVELGRIVAAVRESDPSLESTVLICTSDHGDSGGAHGLPFKGSWMYKEVLHVPMLVKHPGSETRAIRALTSHIDIVPTICDFAQVEPSGNVPLPGKSLRPLLDGSAGAIHPGGVFAEQDFHVLSETAQTDAIETVIQKVGGDVWRYTHYLNEVFNNLELYNLTEDIRELENRASDRPNLAALLQSRMDYWYESTPPDPNVPVA